MTRSGKFNAKPQVIDGHRFASKKEALHYLLLKAEQKAGRISGLELQPKFPMPALSGSICTYIADFRYRDKEGKMRVVDVKGMQTPVFKLKLRMLKYFYPDVEVILG